MTALVQQDLVATIVSLSADVGDVVHGSSETRRDQISCLGRGNGHCGDYLGVGVGAVEGKRVMAPADLEVDHLAGGHGLEQGHDVLMGESEDADPVHVDQDIAWNEKT